MAQYINKSAVVTEIEKRLSLLENGTGDSEVMKRVEGVIKGYKSILSFLDTLEVKEIDLEKECAKYFEENDLCVHDDYIKFARHFFELGLKTQKGK